MEINVEEIMQEIRANLKECDWEDLPSFDSVPIRAQTGAESSPASTYAQEVDAMNRTGELVYTWPLSPNPVKRFAQRAIKRTLKFLFLPLMGQQNEFNAHAVRAMNWTKGHIDGLTVDTESLKQRAAMIEQHAATIEKTATETAEDLSNRAADLEQRVQMLQQRVDELETQNDDLLAALAKRALGQNPAAALRERAIASSADSSETPAAEPSDSIYTALDYFKFENHFRGARSVIRDRQAVYLPYFQNQAGPILDLGCGRGEFLQLMKQNDIPAFGIDLYPEYVEEGKLLGLDIRQGDGIAWLRGAEEQFGGIFVGQVIEHISFRQLQELCSLAYEKLLPGAWLVLETPNPMCLSVFANSFYMDPSHDKPVHPFTLKYLLEELGFRDVNLLFTECSRLEPLPLIQSAEIKNIGEVNAGLTRVSDLLFGSQDYAVAAKKG